MLEVGEIDDGSNFFELGGHSMLAALLVSRCERAVGAAISLQLVFENPVFADFVDAVLHCDEDVSRLPRVVATDLTQAPLSLQQQEYLAVERSIGLPVNNMVAVVEVGAPVSLDALRDALNAVVRGHPALRTTLRGEDTQTVAPPQEVLPVPCTEIDLAGRPRERRTALLRSRVMRAHLVPFDLATGPGLRCQIFRNGDDPDVLVLHLHHALCDGNCVGLLLDDLAAACVGRELQPADPDEPGHLDYCRWQRDNAEEMIDASREHWRRVVRALAMEPVEPSAGEPGSSFVRSGTSLSVTDTHRLRTWVAADGLTEFSTVAAAAALAVRRVIGRSTAGIGLLLDGRAQAGLERTIGSFALSSLMAVDTGQVGTPREFIAQVQRNHLAARRWTQLPLETLLAEPTEELGVTPAALVDMVVDFERIYRMNRPGRLPFSVGLDLNELLRLPQLGPRRALTAVVQEDDRLALVIECAADPAERASAEALLAATADVLAFFAHHPDTAVDEMTGAA